MATNYDINYNDDRFQKVEADKKAALNEVDVTYGNMISQSDKYYKDQMDAAQNWADKQTQIQNEKTDFAIDKIEQQKDQAKKDYTKEQSGAYVDWQKQSNQYGANAEQVAAGGLQNTGFAESSQVAMYNTYQNRVATAREAYVLAVQNYDNAIAEAKLQNSSLLAEIAYEAMQKQLELSLQGFQYKNTLVLEKANKKTQLNSEYYARYQDVLKQINTENAMAEEIRQYNEKMAEEKRQYNETLALQKAQLAEEKRQFNEQMDQKKNSGGNGGEEEYVFDDLGDPLDDTHTQRGLTELDLVVANSNMSLDDAVAAAARGEIYVEQIGNKVYITENPNYALGTTTNNEKRQLNKLKQGKTRTLR